MTKMTANTFVRLCVAIVCVTACNLVLSAELVVPMSICGQQALKAKLSSSGKLLLLAGTGWYPQSNVDKAHAGDVEFLFHTATVPNAQIGIMPFPYKDASEFKSIKSLNHFFVVLDLDIISEPSEQIAFIARESKAEFLKQDNSLGQEEKTRRVIDFWGSIQENSASEVLYVMSPQNNQVPIKVATIKDGVAMNTVRDISMVSVCWSYDNESLFYYSGDALFNVAINGDPKRIYEFMGEKRAISFLRAVKNGVMFIEQGFQGPPSGKNMIPSLVLLSDQGVVLERRTLEVPFNPETPETNVFLASTADSRPFPQKPYFVTPDQYNFAVIGENKYATFDKEIDFTNATSLPKYKLTVRSLAAPQKVFVEYEFTDKTIPFYYNLCGFTPGDKEIIFTKKVNVGGNYSKNDLPENVAERLGILPCSLHILPAQK